MNAPRVATILCLTAIAFVHSSPTQANTAWQLTREVARDPDTQSEFGLSVDIDSGGVVATAVAAPSPGSFFQGSAVTFSATGMDTPVELIPSVIPTNNAFIYPAISATRVLVGDDEDPNPTTGAAYLFDRTTGQELARLTAPDGTDGQDFWFGQGVELTSNHAIAVSAAFAQGGAYVFDSQDGSFLRKLTNGEATFSPAAIAAEGNVAIVSEAGKERAYLFDLDTGSLLRELLSPQLPNQDIFGIDVAISGDYAAVSSRRTNGDDSAGFVSVYEISTGILQYTLPGNSQQLSGIDLDGQRLIVAGSPLTQIHDVATGSLLSELPAAEAVAIDGRTAVLANENIVQVYVLIPEPGSLLIAVQLAAVGILRRNKRGGTTFAS